MSCCGGRRSQIAPNRNAVTPQMTTIAEPGRPALVIVRYDGKGTLTGYGSATGRKYRFPPGTEVAVDIRDRHGLRGVPNLREVRFA